MSLNRSQLGKRLARIERELAEIKKWVLPKRMLSLSEAIPPKSICQDILSKTAGVNDYAGFLAMLCDYFHVPSMGLYWDQYKLWLPPKSEAAYFADKEATYTRTKTVDQHTVLHEFFHHLVAQNVVAVKKREEEKSADKFASLVLDRGGKR